MTQAMHRRMMILVDLHNGRRLKSDRVSHKWEDKGKAPGLTSDVCWLYCAGLVENELKNWDGCAYGDNLTGYTVITSSGQIQMKRFLEGV